MAPTLQFVIGTRREIIKLSAVICECLRRDIDFELVNTGQHYAETLEYVFFAQLDLPEATHELTITSNTHSADFGEMITGIEGLVTARDSRVVLVHVGSSSGPAGAIVENKPPHVDPGHVEVGLRSSDPDMPEEINRRLTDHVAEYLWPTRMSRGSISWTRTCHPSGLP